MKKSKTKSLEKKVRKSIRNEISEQLTLDISKAIASQGRDPKKANKEIKKAVLLISKKLADKEVLSLDGEKDKKNKDAEPLKKEVNSFEVNPVSQEKTNTSLPLKGKSSKNGEVIPAETTLVSDKNDTVRRSTRKKSIVKQEEPLPAPAGELNIEP